MSPPVAVAVVAFALVVVVVVVLPRFEVHSPVVGLLRVLLPSWRFFDAIADPPLLTARVVTADGTPGPWEPVLPAPTRSWWNVAWHPAGNVSFACHSLLFRLRQDLSWCAPDDAPDELVTYQLVLDLVRWRVRWAAPAAVVAGAAVQFRLIEPAATAGPPAEPAAADGGDTAVELLRSAVHPL